MTTALRTQPADMDQAEFLSVFGGLYEHSPWIAEKVHSNGLNAGHNNPTVLHEAFCKVINSASRQQQLNLLRAHPDLAGKLARADELTDASRSEQAGAGLDQCSDEEYRVFTELNNRYKERFGFPFIMAVKGAARTDILLQFQQRVDNNPDTEFAAALLQVQKIGWLRLAEILND
jgi:OHCU decarboxylase